MELYINEIVAGQSIILLILMAVIIRLQKRLKKVLRGNQTESIEDSISLIEHDIKNFKHFKKEMSEYLEAVEKRLKRSVQGVGTVRFNPFKGDGSGSNQSFASSFVNEQGEGVVISSLYSRDHVSIFAKPLKNFKSEYELSNEEKDSLHKAQETLNQNPK